MKTTLSLLAATLGITGIAVPAHANTVPISQPTSKPDRGLSEIPDAELADMRGRYTIGQNTVAYFGVTMVSTWQSTSGQQLQAAMKVAIDATQNSQTPSVTFQPTVNITSIVPGMTPLPSNSSSTTQRSVDSSGLVNVSGLTQGVQVAGDGNQATNVTNLQVSQSSASSNSAVAGSTVSGALASAQPQTQTMTVGDATVTSSAGPEGVQLLLSIANQGSVQQWIRSGSVGQMVQLTSDYQQVSNRMDITLVQQSLAGNLQLAQSVAQSLGQMR